MKLFLTHIMAVSLLIQSIAFSFSFNNAIAMSEHVPIQESETSFDIADLTDDELLFIQFARQREREHDLCKDAGGSKGYSLELIENPDSIDETDKK